MKRVYIWSLVVLIVLVGFVVWSRVISTGPEKVAAPTPARFPAIVVFDERADFSQFEGRYQPDERAAVDPEAWGYLSPGVVGAVRTIESSHDLQADQVYSAALRGFSARLTAAQIQALEKDPLVAYVEADGTVVVSAQLLPWGADRVSADTSSVRAGDGRGEMSNVNVVIIDTGIDQAHLDLNVAQHVNFTGPRGGGNLDCHGHGTLVAGTAAARDNAIDVVGVAPGAKLTGVKVLDCQGTGLVSTVTKGIDWVTARVAKPAVATIGFGGAVSRALDDAIRRSAQAGTVYAVAAGNNRADTCQTSPARAGAGYNNGIITTAATDPNDQEAPLSNFGPCVDLWAPGVEVPSTRLGGGTTANSGTSMAVSHVAGTAALLLSSDAGLTAPLVEGQLKFDATVTSAFSKDGRPIRVVNTEKY